MRSAAKDGVTVAPDIFARQSVETTKAFSQINNPEHARIPIKDNLETANFDGKTWSNPKHGGGSVAGHYIHWHTFDDNAKSVTEDVLRIRNHPLVPGHIPIYGFIYDVKTGKLNEVTEATSGGKPR